MIPNTTVELSKFKGMVQVCWISEPGLQRELAHRREVQRRRDEPSEEEAEHKDDKDDDDDGRPEGPPLLSAGDDTSGTGCVAACF